MRNLLFFLVRFGGILTFVVFEIVCFYLIINYNKSQREVFINSTSLFSGYLYDKSDQLNRYLHLSQISDSLSSENKKLLQEKYGYLPTQFSVDTVKADSNTILAYTFIPSKVRNNSINLSNNYITLDKGESHGVKRNMGVIGEKGIVGIVRKTSSNYAKVMSLLHQQTRINASIKSNNYFGTLRWRDSDPRFMNLEAIPKHVKVIEGDTIQTSGYSSIFPEGIMIGTVSEVTIPPGSNFYQISVRLANDLQEIKYAYVINYMHKEEQLLLEQRSKNE